MSRGRIALAALALSLMAAPALAWAQATVLLVRHAEKVDESDDPPLSDAGRQRAEALAKLLAQSGISAIYTSQYQRTIQTAAPLARALGLQPTVVQAKAPDEVVARLRQMNPDQVALVVGHSNTIPEIAAKLGASRPMTTEEIEYGLLLLLAPGPEGRCRMMRLRF